MGIAILCIILFHQRFFSNDFSSFFRHFGFLGVDVFLFVSGFGIYYSLKKGQELDESVNSFYARRLMRILPTCIIGGMAFLYFWMHGAPKLYHIGSINFYSAFVGLDVWYIRTILIFYAISPLLFKLLKYNKYPWILLFIIWLLTPFIHDFCEHWINGSFEGASRQFMSQTVVWSVDRFPAYLMGLTIAHANLGFKSISRFKSISLGLIALILFICARYIELPEDPVSEYFRKYFRTFATIIPALPVLCIACDKLASILPEIITRGLRWCGNLSLELFLAHSALFPCVRQAYGSGVLLFFVCLFASFAMAILLKQVTSVAVDFCSQQIRQVNDSKALSLRETKQRNFLTWLGGLRGFAILLVLFFHFQPNYFSQGFLGVDVFFVISGYLLFLHYEEFRAFDIVDFIKKKIFRIVPLLSTVCILGSLIVLPVLFSIDVLEELGASTLASLLAYSNFDYIERYADYFAANSNLNAFLHTWYLSALLQIYLLWALGCFLMYRCSKSLRLLVLIVLAGASLVYHYSYDIQKIFESIGLPTWGQLSSTPYYHTFGRLWQVIAGGFVFLLPAIRSKNWQTILALIGLTGLISVTLCNTSFSPCNALFAVTFTVLLIWNAEGISRFRFILENKPLLWFGKISFSLYLIHFPIIVFYKRYTRNMPSLWTAVVLSIIAVLVAYFVWKLIEKRKFSFKSTIVLYALALLGSVFTLNHKQLGIDFFASSAVQYPVYQPHEMQPEVSAEVMKGFEPKILYSGRGTRSLLLGNQDFTWEDTDPIMQISNVKQSPEFLLIGDSTAQQMYAGFDTVSNELGVCGVHLSTTVIPLWNRFLFLNTRWYKWDRQKAYNLVSWLKQHPNIHTIFIGQIWLQRLNYRNFRDWNGKLKHFNTNQNINALREFCLKLKEAGKNVVLIAPSPIYNGLTDSGLEYMRWRERCGGGLNIENHELPEAITHDYYQKYFEPVNSVFSEWEKRGFVKILHIDKAMFKDGDWLMYKEGKLLCRDATHITPYGSIVIMKGMKDEFMEYIKQGRKLQSAK